MNQWQNKVTEKRQWIQAGMLIVWVLGTANLFAGQYGFVTSPARDSDKQIVIKKGNSVYYSCMPTGYQGQITDYSWIFEGGNPSMSNSVSPGLVEYDDDAEGKSNEASLWINHIDENNAGCSNDRITVAKVVVPKLILDVPMETKDGSSANFKVSVLPVNITPSSYKWSWEPDSNNCGNNPNVNFEDDSKAETSVDNAHWYASPDNPNASVTGYSCIYKINCEVDIKGVKIKKENDSYWSVCLPNKTAEVPWPLITGMPITLKYTDANGQNTWLVVGQGDLRRPVLTENSIIYHISTNSQFYNKCKEHEKVHVNQWMQQTPWCDYFDADKLYANKINSLSSTVSEQDLLSKIESAINKQNNDDSVLANASSRQREEQAYNVSNPISPAYLQRDY